MKTFVVPQVPLTKVSQATSMSPLDRGDVHQDYERAKQLTEKLQTLGKEKQQSMSKFKLQGKKLEGPQVHKSPLAPAKQGKLVSSSRELLNGQQTFRKTTESDFGTIEIPSIQRAQPKLSVDRFGSKMMLEIKKVSSIDNVMDCEELYYPKLTQKVAAGTQMNSTGRTEKGEGSGSGSNQKMTVYNSFKWATQIKDQLQDADIQIAEKRQSMMERYDVDIKAEEHQIMLKSALGLKSQSKIGSPRRSSNQQSPAGHTIDHKRNSKISSLPQSYKSYVKPNDLMNREDSRERNGSGFRQLLKQKSPRLLKTI